MNSTPFAILARERLSRRRFIAGASSLVAALYATQLGGCEQRRGSSLTFKSLSQTIADDDAVAAGYQATPIIRWGDPVMPDAPPFDPKKLTPADQALQFGYNNDFVAYFPLPRGSTQSDHGLLFVNHEYTNPELMFPDYDPANQTAVQTQVELMAHGASVVEVAREGRTWEVVANSAFARRITGDTMIAISGPAAGHYRLMTAEDPTGTRVRGTLGNCAGGTTPWGTALTCEENVQSYFGGSTTDELDAYRLSIMGFAAPGRFRPWHTSMARFDVAQVPNEPARFGWVVEVDPYDPHALPVKRTALGRFKHEAATTVVAVDGSLVVYMGDDEAGQYLYRYVSQGVFDPGRGAANSILLDEGTLYVARFDADGLSWLPLVQGQGPLTAANGFSSQAEVLIDVRLAALALGATPMDRPEDVEVDPVNGRVYVMLTNNTSRAAAQTDPANPRANNEHGHILELVPPASPDGTPDHSADRFQWDVFLLAGDAASGGRYGEGTQVWMSSPDNCAFDPKGRLWIASDQGKKQAVHGIADGMFACDTDGEGRAVLKFFYAVPRGAECCGPCFTPDGKTLFVAVQHPGEGEGSESSFGAPSTRWPDFKDDMPPRPSIVAIVKDDGRQIGG